jgi:hypothetical protein
MSPQSERRIIAAVCLICTIEEGLPEAVEVNLWRLFLNWLVCEIFLCERIDEVNISSPHINLRSPSVASGATCADAWVFDFGFEKLRDLAGFSGFTDGKEKPGIFDIFFFSRVIPTMCL